MTPNVPMPFPDVLPTPGCGTVGTLCSSLTTGGTQAMQVSPNWAVFGPCLPPGPPRYQLLPLPFSPCLHTVGYYTITVPGEEEC